MATPDIWYSDFPLWDRTRHMVRRYLLVLRPWEVPESGQAGGAAGGVAYGLAERLQGRGWTDSMLAALADIEHELDTLRRAPHQGLSARSGRMWQRWQGLVRACQLDRCEEDVLTVLACGE
ncbi:MAG: hypothetical protein AAGC55_24295, partial [Myxococcota bacterium]